MFEGNTTANFYGEIMLDFSKVTSYAGYEWLNESSGEIALYPCGRGEGWVIQWRLDDKELRFALHEARDAEYHKPRAEVQHDIEMQLKTWAISPGPKYRRIKQLLT